MFLFSRLRERTLGWRSARSRSVRCGCSLRASNNRGASCLMVAMRSGAWTPRMPTSGWEERARGSWWVCVLHACIHPFMIPCIRLFMHACVRSHSFVQQAVWHGAGLCYLACRTQCFCAGIRDAARCDCLVQKTRKIAEQATHRGGRGCIVHVR